MTYKVFLKLKRSLGANKQQSKKNMNMANEYAITHHQSETTYHERSEISRFKKLECTVDKQSDKSLGFCYRRLQYGRVKTENELLVHFSFFSLIIVCSLPTVILCFTLHNGSVLSDCFLNRELNMYNANPPRVLAILQTF